MEIVIFDVEEEQNENKNSLELQYQNLVDESKIEKYHLQNFLDYYKHIYSLTDSNIENIMLKDIINFCVPIVDEKGIMLQLDYKINALYKGKIISLPSNKKFGVCGLYFPKKFFQYYNLYEFNFLNMITDKDCITSGLYSKNVINRDVMNKYNFNLQDSLKLQGIEEYVYFEKNNSSSNESSNNFSNEKNKNLLTKIKDCINNYLYISNYNYHNFTFIIGNKIKAEKVIDKKVKDEKVKAEKKSIESDVFFNITGVQINNILEILNLVQFYNIQDLFKLGISKGINDIDYKNKLDLFNKSKNKIEVKRKVFIQTQVSPEKIKWSNLVKAVSITDLKNAVYEIKDTDPPEGFCIHSLDQAKIDIQLYECKNNDLNKKYLETRTEFLDKYGYLENDRYYCKICGEYLTKNNQNVTNLQDEKLIVVDNIQLLVWKDISFIVENYIKFMIPINPKIFINSLTDGIKKVINSININLNKSKINTQENINDILSIYSGVYVLASICSIIINNPGKISFKNYLKKDGGKIRKKRGIRSEKRKSEKSKEGINLFIGKEEDEKDKINLYIGKNEKDEKDEKDEKYFIGRGIKKENKKENGIFLMYGNIEDEDEITGGNSNDISILKFGFDKIITLKNSLITKISQMNKEVIKNIFLKEAYPWAKNYIKINLVSQTSSEDLNYEFDSSFIPVLFYIRKFNLKNDENFDYNTNNIEDFKLIDFKSPVALQLKDIKLNVKYPVDFDTNNETNNETKVLADLGIKSFYDALKDYKVYNKLYDIFMDLCLQKEIYFISKLLFKIYKVPENPEFNLFLKKTEFINKIFDVIEINYRKIFVYFKTKKIPRINYISNLRDIFIEYAICELDGKPHIKNNGVCSKCGKNVMQIPHNKNFIDIYKKLDDISAVFSYYYDRCPVGNLHEINNSICSKCGINLSEIDKKYPDMKNKKIKDYYEKYKELYDKDNYFDDKIKFEYKTEYKKKDDFDYKYNLKNISDVSTLLGIKYNLIINLGLYEGHKKFELMESKINPSKDNILLEVRATKLRSYINDILRNYNCIKNYNNSEITNYKIKELFTSYSKTGNILKQYRPFEKNDLHDYPDFGKQFYEQNILEFKGIGNKELYCNFLLNFICKIVIDLYNWKTLNVFAKMLAKFLITDIIDKELMLCKPEFVYIKNDNDESESESNEGSNEGSEGNEGNEGSDESESEEEGELIDYKNLDVEDGTFEDDD